MHYIQLKTGIIWASSEEFTFDERGYFSGACHKASDTGNSYDRSKLFMVNFHRDAVICDWKWLTRAQ